jgi:hypothetical protein
MSAKRHAAFAQAAVFMRTVQEKTGPVLDRGGSSLHHTEGILQDTTERVSTALRAGKARSVQD